MTLYEDPTPKPQSLNPLGAPEQPVGPCFVHAALRSPPALSSRLQRFGCVFGFLMCALWGAEDLYRGFGIWGFGFYGLRLDDLGLQGVQI